MATLLAKGIEQTDFLFWELDWDGDGQKDTMDQRSPFQEVTCSFPGDYFPVFNFYNDRNELIAQAGGSITVAGQSSNGAADTGSQSQALSAVTPGGWGIVKDTQSSSGRRPVEDLSDAPDSWSPPTEEFTEYLKPQLYVSGDSRCGRQFGKEGQGYRSDICALIKVDPFGGRAPVRGGPDALAGRRRRSA